MHLIVVTVAVPITVPVRKGCSVGRFILIPDAILIGIGAQLHYTELGVSPAVHVARAGEDPKLKCHKFRSHRSADKMPADTVLRSIAVEGIATAHHAKPSWAVDIIGIEFAGQEVGAFGAQSALVKAEVMSIHPLRRQGTGVRIRGHGLPEHQRDLGTVTAFKLMQEDGKRKIPLDGLVYKMATVLIGPDSPARTHKVVVRIRPGILVGRTRQTAAHRAVGEVGHRQILPGIINQRVALEQIVLNQVIQTIPVRIGQGSCRSDLILIEIADAVCVVIFFCIAGEQVESVEVFIAVVDTVPVAVGGEGVGTELALGRVRQAVAVVIKAFRLGRGENKVIEGSHRSSGSGIASRDAALQGLEAGEDDQVVVTERQLACNQHAVLSEQPLLRHVIQIEGVVVPLGHIGRAVVSSPLLGCLIPNRETVGVTRTPHRHGRLRKCRQLR